MHETDEYVIIQITITRVITGYLRQFIKLKPPYNLPHMSLVEPTIYVFYKWREREREKEREKESERKRGREREREGGRERGDIN